MLISGGQLVTQLRSSQFLQLKNLVKKPHLNFCGDDKLLSPTEQTTFGILGELKEE